jgi:hypothetical protein
MAITINGPYTAYLALVASKRAAGCAETREAAASVAFKEANQATIDGAAAELWKASQACFRCYADMATKGGWLRLERELAREDWTPCD